MLLLRHYISPHPSGQFLRFSLSHWLTLIDLLVFIFILFGFIALLDIVDQHLNIHNHQHLFKYIASILISTYLSLLPISSWKCSHMHLISSYPLPMHIIFFLSISVWMFSCESICYSLTLYSTVCSLLIYPSSKS